MIPADDGAVRGFRLSAELVARIGDHLATDDGRSGTPPRAVVAAIMAELLPTAGDVDRDARRVLLELCDLLSDLHAASGDKSGLRRFLADWQHRQAYRAEQREWSLTIDQIVTTEAEPGGSDRIPDAD
ncbi:hypothetical protein P3T37_004343 [Kitasatospora sp. MAA4]|uniref:hypothetical protein n=1 Tax=Kitasatospora sp. MAA4 TaxID=3035093 RepID=UPI002476C403|nr:hypothetical protein [Kitasatospora sp. MAA4]MDH6134934.1 hypothetical protein [Kitasatospora sp. MAA4]